MGFAMRPGGHKASHAPPPVPIGIDLGTAYSRVGVWRDGDVMIIPNERGKLATPSCVAFTDQCVLVGEAAQDQADVNLDNTIFAPQRLLGSKMENSWVQWYMKTRPSKVVFGNNDQPMIRVLDRGKEKRLRPEEIVALLLEHLRKLVELHLGVTAIEAVVAIPAQYGQQQCEALVEAAKGARLRVLNLVKSPTAASIAFCLTNPSVEKRHLLVCDMGASYFDWALILAEGESLSERASGTDYVDLDNSLSRYCKQDLKERFHVTISGPGAPLAELKLRSGCELAKRKLSQLPQARIEVSNVVEGLDYLVTISRGHFEDCCRYDIDPLLDPIDWCLEDAGLSRSDVEVVLVGGCARIPRVRRALREFFYGRAPREVLRPDHAAVLGAAVYVASLAGVGGGEDGIASVPKDLQGLRLDHVMPWAAPVANPLEQPVFGLDCPIGVAVTRSSPSPEDDDEFDVMGNEGAGRLQPVPQRLIKQASGNAARLVPGI